MAGDRYLNIKELAEYSGLSVRHLRDLMPEIPHYRPGKKILVKRSEFDEWIQQHKYGVPHPKVAEMLERLAS